MTKALAAVLTVENGDKNLFFVDGVSDTTNEKYEKALSDSQKTVCLLVDAPKKNLSEHALLNMMQVDYSASEKKSDVKSGKASAKVWTMLVRVTSGDEILSISCRLAGNIKLETGLKQFKRAFGGLLANP